MADDSDNEEENEEENEKEETKSDKKSGSQKKSNVNFLQQQLNQEQPDEEDQEQKSKLDAKSGILGGLSSVSQNSNAMPKRGNSNIPQQQFGEDSGSSSRLRSLAEKMAAYSNTSSGGGGY